MHVVANVNIWQQQSTSFWMDTLFVISCHVWSVWLVLVLDILMRDHWWGSGGVVCMLWIHVGVHWCISMGRCIKVSMYLTKVISVWGCMGWSLAVVGFDRGRGWGIPGWGWCVAGFETMKWHVPYGVKFSCIVKYFQNFWNYSKLQKFHSWHFTAVFSSLSTRWFQPENLWKFSFTTNFITDEILKSYANAK